MAVSHCFWIAGNLEMNGTAKTLAFVRCHHCRSLLVMIMTFGGNDSVLRSIRQVAMNFAKRPYLRRQILKESEAAKFSQPRRLMSASLIGHFESSAFRLSTAAVSMSLAGSCFSSDSAPRPFHHGIRRRGGTIFAAALPLDQRQVQADMRTHLIHRPARDIIPPLGGARVFSYRVWFCTVVMLLRFPPGSSGTRCRQPRCGA